MNEGWGGGRVCALLSSRAEYNLLQERERHEGLSDNIMTFSSLEKNFGQAHSCQVVPQVVAFKANVSSRPQDGELLTAVIGVFHIAIYKRPFKTRRS